MERSAILGTVSNTPYRPVRTMRLPIMLLIPVHAIVLRLGSGVITKPRIHAAPLHGGLIQKAVSGDTTMLIHGTTRLIGIIILGTNGIRRGKISRFLS